MSTYSFLDCNATISGPGGSINLASGAAASEEGITVEAIADKNVLTIGADGAGMHSLIANEASTLTVRLLKTSPVNAVLMQMYNYQTSSSILHGKNTLVITDLGRGDLIVCDQAAFKKAPPINYAKEGGIVEWTFDAIRTSRTLGVGTPEA